MPRKRHTAEQIIGLLRQAEVELAQGLRLLPKRRIVELTTAWSDYCRRLAGDCENLDRPALAFLHLAPIRLMPGTPRNHRA